MSDSKHFKTIQEKTLISAGPKPTSKLEAISSSYGIWNHGIIHYEKAEKLYALRGWGAGKGNRLRGKKLCDCTYLNYNEEDKTYFITYGGTKILTVLPNFRWIVHPHRNSWGATIGLRTRVNCFAPVNLFSHNYQLYAGSKKRPLDEDLVVDIYDHFHHPETWWNSNNYHAHYGRAQKPQLFAKVNRAFSQVLDSYLLMYFSSWSGTSWERFLGNLVPGKVEVSGTKWRTEVNINPFLDREIKDINPIKKVDSR